MRFTLRLGCLVVLLTTLSGCTGLFPFFHEPSNSAPPTYQLRSDVVLDGEVGRPLDGQLNVEKPEAILILSGNRILFRPFGDMVTYLRGAQWADRLPRLVQESLISSMRSNGVVRVVSRSYQLGAPSSDYELFSEIQDFSIVRTEQGKEAHVQIYLSLLDRSSRVSLGGKTFDVALPVAPGGDVDSDVHALGHAFEIFLTQAVRWANLELRKRSQGRSSKKRVPGKSVSERRG